MNINKNENPDLWIHKNHDKKLRNNVGRYTQEEAKIQRKIDAPRLKR